MGTVNRTAALAVMFAVVLAAAAGVWADAPATPAELQKMVDEGSPAAAVAGASRLVNASGDAAAGVDKAAAYAVKGEGHLHLKQYAQAADAFAHAAALASDPATAATDKATELLVRRSPKGLYTPKQLAADGARPAPVDVVSRDDRKAAFALLFADEFAAAGSKLRAARTAHTVPQLLAAADTANTLRQLELAATGTDEKTKPEVAAVADHARGLMQTNLDTMTKRVAEIAKAANAVTTYYGRPTAAYNRLGNQTEVRRTRKMGLTGRNKLELADIQTTCQKIGPAADAFAKATADTAGDGAGWETLSAEATHTASQATDALNADYSNGINDRP